MRPLDAEQEQAVREALVSFGLTEGQAGYHVRRLRARACGPTDPGCNLRPMDAALTGREATEALKLYASLGELGARFDAKRVRAAVLSRVGRLRLSAAIRLARAGVAVVRPVRRFRAPRSRASRPQSVSRASGDAPPRPPATAAPTGRRISERGIGG